jgi:hypothetical protein
LQGIAKVTELDDTAKLLLDLALLLDTLITLLLDCGVTLEEDDFAELLDKSSQSSHSLEEESPEDCTAKPLPSSPHATRAMANKRTMMAPITLRVPG